MSEQAYRVEEDQEAVAFGEERRAAVRRPSNLPVRCHALAPDAPVAWAGRLRDIGSLGAGLIFAHPINVGELLRLDFAEATGGTVRDVLARVAHVTTHAEGWLVGCALIRDLENATLRLFQAEKVRAPAGDCRRWVRFPCDVEAVCDSPDTTAGEQRPARVVNVSAGGLGLLLPCEFGAGSLLRLRLPGMAGPALPEVLLRVVRAGRLANADWLLGCEFADELSEAELTALRE